MKKQTVTTTIITPDEKVESVHYSDGSELIPSEVKSKLQSKENLVAGYTKDDEGIINNYGLEPDMFAASYPTPKQQLRYVFLGVGALVLVSTLLLIGFAVSQ
jgi:hypothetical protein